MKVRFDGTRWVSWQVGEIYPATQVPDELWEEYDTAVHKAVLLGKFILAHFEDQHPHLVRSKDLF